MTGNLARIAEEADPDLNAFLNTRRAARLEAELPRVSDLQQRVALVFALGRELMLAGETEKAIDAFLQIRELFEHPGSKVNPHLLRQLGEALATAYLRLGEQENCVALHTAGSCILPIDATGRHKAERGSRAAIRELQALLEARPDAGLRWLLNIAYMTVGEYPEGVPAAWRIPPQAFSSSAELQPFSERAGELGLDVIGLSGGVVMEDLDGNGFLDVLASSWGLTDQIRLFLSNGDGTFADATAPAGLQGQVGGLNLNHADYDNDGDADVLVLRGAWLGPNGRHPNSLLRNNGDGTFTDVTATSGLLDFHPTQAGAWADFDLDGHLDLFIGNESGREERARSNLFHSNGDGTFTDVAASVGLEIDGFVKAAAWGDIDNDGLQDLFVSRLGQPNQLFRNLGPVERGGGFGWRFAEVTALAGVAEPLLSFPAWFWDYDNDGWLDLFVASFSGLFANSLSSIVSERLGEEADGERPRLYRNLGDGTFADVTRQTGLWRILLAMGANFGDLDNDGWLDIYLGTGEPNLATLVPNVMFRGLAGGGFEDVTGSGRFGHIQKGHGIAFGDLDNDGDQDIYAVMGGAYEGDTYQNALFVNPGSGNRWLTLTLEGTRSNRSALGARVRVEVRTPRGPRSIHRVVGSGGSFGSSSLQLEIGLGDATAIDRVSVDWPTRASSQTFAGLEPDGVYRLKEGQKEARRLTRVPFELKGSTGRHDAAAHGDSPDNG